MPPITYTPAFQFTDWIDNEDVVQAGGDRGFNKLFNDLRGELTRIATVVGDIATAINQIQRLRFVMAEAGTTLPATSVSAEFPVETYDRSTLPANVERAYFAVIFPISGPTNVLHTFLYHTAPGNQVAVTIQFANPGAAQARFSWRILTLATQA
jgi:hypothetical protein